jgi:NADPH-dependent 7-cyano-7-deazaguanine reductase QueF
MLFFQMIKYFIIFYHLKKFHPSTIHNILNPKKRTLDPQYHVFYNTVSKIRPSIIGIFRSPRSSALQKVKFNKMKTTNIFQDLFVDVSS